jgi:hypothetical protein
MDENSFSNPNKVIYSFGLSIKLPIRDSEFAVDLVSLPSSSESRSLCYTIVQVVPVKSQLFDAGAQMQVTLAPHSFTSFDLALAPSKLVTLADV